MYGVLFYCALLLVVILHFRTPFPTHLYVIACMVVIALAINVSAQFQRQSYKWRENRILLLSALMLAGWGIWWVQCWYQWDIVDRTGVSAQDNTRMLLIQMTFWLIAGFIISQAVVRIYYPSVISLSILAFAIYLWATNVDDAFTFNYNEIASSDNLVLSHLDVSDYLVILFFFAFAISNQSTKLLCVPVMAIVLFAAGGRFALIFSFFTIILTQFFSSRAEQSLPAIIGSIAAFVALAIIVDPGNTEAYRMMFEGDIAEDKSVINRIISLKESQTTVGLQFWYGNPRVIVEQFGSVGAYAHNLFSAYQYFGFFYFGLLVLVIIMAINNLIRTRKDIHLRPFDHFRALVLVYAVLGVLVAKYFAFFLLWFAIGLWSKGSTNKPGVQKSQARLGLTRS